MKVNVSVEATAQEMREFLGLPNVQPLHDDILQAVRDNMKRGAINFDALGLLKPLLPTQFYSMEMAKKFWEAVAKASGGNTAAVKETTDRKTEQSPESGESGAARDDHEKPA